MSTKQQAVTPPSDINVDRTNATEGRGTESPGRGERPDGSGQVPDRQPRYRNV